MNKTLIAIISLMIVPISGLGIDIYVPSLPAMASYFGVGAHIVQYTITIYIAGYAVSQLFAGFVSDVYGRRITTLISLVVFGLMSLAIILFKQVDFILLCRFIQGFSVEFFAVSQRAIVVDVYANDSKKMQNMMSYVSIAWSIGPIIAPAIGGYLQHYFNWQANFIFLIVYICVAFTLFLFFVPETLKHKSNINLAYIRESYLTILTNKNFNWALLCNGTLYTIGISFSTIGAFIIEQQMEYSSIQFGYCALLLGVGWFIGNVLKRMLHRYSIQKKVFFATNVTLLIIIIAFILSFKWLNIYSLVVPIIVMNIFAGMIFASYFVFSATMFPRFAGNAGALYGSGFLFFTSIVGSILGRIISTTSATPLLLSYVVLTLICYISTRLITFKKP